MNLQEAEKLIAEHQAAQAAQERAAIAERAVHESLGRGGLVGSKSTQAPKPWVDCSIEEKLERLRQHVKAGESEQQ